MHLCLVWRCVSRPVFSVCTSPRWHAGTSKASRGQRQQQEKLEWVRPVQCVPGVAKAFVQGKTCRSVQERAGSRDGGQLKHAISATRFLPRIAEAVKSRQSTQCLRPTVRQRPTVCAKQWCAPLRFTVCQEPLARRCSIPPRFSRPPFRRSISLSSF